LLVALLPDPKICFAKYLYYLLTAEKDHLLVPLMTGTANVSLKEEDIAKSRITLPSLSEQRRIVARIEELAGLVAEAKRHQTSVLADSKALLMSAYRQITRNAERKPMSQVAPLTRRPASVDVDAVYPQISVRSFGNGTFYQPALRGAEITWQKLYQVKEYDILISNIKAWEGAVAVVAPEDDGRYGSHRYLTCVPIPGIATAGFVCFHLLTPEGLYHLGEASPGSADRNRTLNSELLMQIPIPVIAIEDQRWFDKLGEESKLLATKQAASAVELGALVPSILDKAFRGDL